MRFDGVDTRILENLNTAVLLFDGDMRLAYINPAGEILFEVSARHILGQMIDQLLPNADAFIASLLRAAEGDRPFTEREVVLHLPNERRVTVDVTATPVREGYRDREMLLELQVVDHQLRIAREENLLAQYNNTRMLLRGMAHEIKNPLGGLRGAAQLLDQELDDDSLREYTQIIIGEADRLQNLLNRMLGPNTVPAKRLLNIHEVMERVRALMQVEAGPGVTIERDYDPSIPDLYGDADQLIQAVLNITRNALQAVNGEGRIVLQTRAQRQFTLGHRLHKLVARIDIIDDGPGIPADMVENIFYPMITGRADGTGLGLPIAQSLVNQHGGLIECTSRPGETVFTIILPIEANHEQ